VLSQSSVVEAVLLVGVEETSEAVPGYVLINANVLSDVTVGELDSSGVSNPRSGEILFQSLILLID